MHATSPTDCTPAALSIKEACRYAAIGQTKLYSLIKDGKLTKRKLGRRTVILRAELDALLANAPTE